MKMLLRRIKAHIEKENWFAVGVDFCIVVIGVFIGLQVQSWANYRSDRVLEQDYIERLYAEVSELQKVRHYIISGRHIMIDDLKRVNQKIQSGELVKFTPRECFSLMGPPLSNPTDELGVVTELLSSGRLTIFKDKKVSSALADFLLVRARARDSQAAIFRESKDPILLFPNYFDIHRSAAQMIEGDMTDQLSDEKVAGSFVSCDEQAMRGDPAFKNLVFRMTNNSAFHQINNNNVDDALDVLEGVLE